MVSQICVVTKPKKGAIKQLQLHFLEIISFKNTTLISTGIGFIVAFKASGCKITTCSVCYKLFHEGHVIESHDKNIRKLKIEAREALEENENRIQFYREKMDLLESSKDEIDAHTHKTVRLVVVRVANIMEIKVLEQCII